MGNCCKALWMRDIIYGVAPSGPPVNIIAPLITGNPYLNMQLQVSNGTWEGSGITYSYQWKRNGVNIAGQTNATYTMGTSDTVDSLPEVDCEVTGTNSNGSVSVLSSNSMVCTPVITMSCNKITGMLAFAGSLTRKASPTTVLIQWGDGSSSSITGSISKSYASAGIKNIRVYSELNNIATFNVTTASTRLTSFTAVEIMPALTSISITNQSTAGLFNSFTVKNQPILDNIVLTSGQLTSITSTNIDNLPLLSNLMINSMGALTSVTLPVLPSLNTINASICGALSSVSINNNPTLTGINFARCDLSDIDISNLVNLTTLTLGSPSAGNSISSLDITTNNALVTVNLENIGLSTLAFGTLPDCTTFNIASNALSGSISVGSSGLLVFNGSNNDFANISVSSTDLQVLLVPGNAISDISLSGKTVLDNIDVSNNQIIGDDISGMLAELVANGANNGQFVGDSQTPPAPLNAQGLLDQTELESRGWTISVDV